MAEMIALCGDVDVLAVARRVVADPAYARFSVREQRAVCSCVLDLGARLADERRAQIALASATALVVVRYQAWCNAAGREPPEGVSEEDWIASCGELGDALDEALKGLEATLQPEVSP